MARGARNRREVGGDSLRSSNNNEKRLVARPKEVDDCWVVDKWVGLKGQSDPILADRLNGLV